MDIKEGEHTALVKAIEIFLFHGCTMTPWSIRFVVSSSIHSPEYLNIAVFPNPSTGIFRLTSGNVFNTAVLVQIFNVTGMVVKKWYWNGKSENVDISNVAKGVYIIKVTDQKNLGVTKLIVQ